MIISEDRYGEISRNQDVEGTVVQVFGTFDAGGSGEGSISINFPVDFLSRPVFTYGTEVEGLGTGIPEMSVAVIGWATSPRSDGQATYYSGAQLWFKVTGTRSQRATTHWMFTGPALREG